jgi:DNA polymerase-3 subunit gamma/tau
VLAAAKDASRSTGALLMNAAVKALDDGALVLTINSAPLARRLSEPRNTEVIGAALRRVLGVEWRVRCEHDDGSGGGSRGGAQASQSQSPAQPSGARPPSRSNPPPSSQQGANQPSGQAQQPGSRAQVTTTPPSVPLPPEPPTDDEYAAEEEMLAEASATSGQTAPRRDPEEVAIELLAAQLGARAVDER